MSERDRFIAALQIPDPAERSAWLDRECGGDAQLRQRIEVLLEAFAKAGSLLENPAVVPGVTTGPSGPGERSASAGREPSLEAPGTMVGRYKLLEEIGEGGMGTVWMAQQTEPVRRLVAVKLIKAGMDSKQVLARFEAERQALALMDNPNIAKVFDGGAACDGRPYFVMELVKGVPITRYCDAHRLTPRQRLELFVPVCHALQKGIIHRDLKPSNVLVAPHDGKPVPKVIDFGVAKAAGQQLTDQTLVTGFGALVGTLEYMSPEQAELNNQDIDTRSDIYALGILLYELLAGSPPFSRKESEKAGVLEMLQVIREQEPSRPSTKLSTAAGLPTLAANRGTKPAQLTKLVRGELDWIVMKALEKDRTRRYETANAFALDVQRYLANEPVLACPPSAGYRIRKFVRRNRGAVLAAGFVLLALVAGIVGTTLGLVRADRQRQIAVAQQNAAEKARHRTRDALDAMTSAVISDSLMTQPEISAEQKQFLTEVLTYYQEFAGEQAADELSRRKLAAAAYRVGFIEFRLGRTAESAAAFEKARAGYSALATEFPTNPGYRHEWARSLNHLGTLLKNQEHHAEAVECLHAALVLLEQLVDEVPAHPTYRQELARSHTSLGALFAARWKRTEAEGHYRKALALQESVVREFPAVLWHRQELARIQNHLGILLNEVGKNSEAQTQYRQALAVRRQLVAASPAVAAYRQELGTTYQCLGMLLTDLQQHAQAEENYRHALALRQKLAEDFPVRPIDSQELARTHDTLSILLQTRARLAEAEEHCRKALEIRQALLVQSPARPAYREDVASSHINLGVRLHARNRQAEAEEQFCQGLALLRALADEFPTLPRYRQRLGGGHFNLGNLLLDVGKAAEGEVEFRRAVALQEKLAREFPEVPAFRKELARTHHRLGDLLKEQGKATQAEEAFRQARLLQERLAAEFPDLFQVLPHNKLK